MMITRAGALTSPSELVLPSSGIDGRLQARHCGLGVVDFVNAKEADAEAGRGRGRLADHERHSRCELQPLLHHLGHNLGVGGVGHNHTGGLESLGRHALVAPCCEHGAHGLAQVHKAGLGLSKAVLLGLLRGVPEELQGVGGHSGVVGEGPVEVRVHHIAPLLDVEAQGGGGGGVHKVVAGLGEHDDPRACRRSPPLLGRREVSVHAQPPHVDPLHPRGHSVEHERRAHLMSGVSHRLDVRVGEHDAVGGLHVGREDHGGLVRLDLRDHLLDGGGGELRLLIVGVDGPGLNDLVFAGDAALLEDIAPAVGEVAEADHKRLLPAAELAGDGLHGVGAAPREEDGLVAVVGGSEGTVEILHHRLEGLGHGVGRAVSVDNRELVKPALGFDGDRLLVVPLASGGTHHANVSEIIRRRRQQVLGVDIEGGALGHDRLGGGGGMEAPPRRIDQLPSSLGARHRATGFADG
mmetsp:Transcript_58644/g.186961  ORF Transcript_58644/g.186961 Transcript_58644/m.186961 type:complete len:465 (-) Transcript_58644:23-1417(-)